MLHNYYKQIKDSYIDVCHVSFDNIYFLIVFLHLTDINIIMVVTSRKHAI